MNREVMQVPAFHTEAEEARWWAQQEDALAEEFLRAAETGRVGEATVARRAALPTTTIRLNPEDVEIAKKQAEKKGLRYQTYLKMLIHEVLHDRESGAQR